MVEIVGTQGSGITEKAIVKFDVALDLRAIVAAANYSIALESFAAIQKMIAETAKNVLLEAKLPCDTRGVYQLKAGVWNQFEGRQNPPGSYSSFIGVFTHLNVPPDSPAG